MANLKDLIVSGPIRAISGVIGDLTGTADKALKDGNGNTITSYYVPTARTVNSKALSSNIVLNGADLVITGYSKPSSTSALAATDTINVALGKLEKALDGKQASGSYVPTSRTINSKALTANITLNYSDVGAAASSHTHTSSEVTDLSTTISSAISGKADSATSLSGYGITDAYTKTEIDGKLSGAMHFKGTKASVSNLPTTGNVQGDMWNVTDTGANYAWDGTAWDKLSENIDLSGYVPTSRTVNGKALSGNISLTASDVGAAASGHTHSVFVKSGTGAAAGFVPAPSTTAGTTKYLREDGTWVVPPGTYTHPTTSGNKHIPSGGSSGQILKWSADGTATWAAEYSYTHPTTSGNKHIPSGGSSGQILKWSADGTATWAAEYSYTHPTTSGNKHIPSGGSSGQFLKWSADGTATWAADNNTLNTAGSTDTSSKIFLVGATSQAANPQTYSHDTAFVDTNGRVNSAAPAADANDTTVATTKWVKDRGYTTNTGTITGITMNGASKGTSGVVDLGTVATSDTKNTAGSTDTSSKIFLVGATSQAANPQTYSHDTVFVDTDGALNSVTPATGNNTTKVATTAFVTAAVGNYLPKSGGTMTGALNFANNTWNAVGDDVAMGDCNIAGHLCIKQLNGASCGIQFYNNSGTALSQLNAVSGGITSSGSLGINNNAAKMQYNSTTEAIEFVFA